MIKKIKISALPLAGSFIGLFTIGVDKDNKSVKIALEFIKTAADNANDAAKNANTKADAADRAASSANQAAGLASSQASNAEDKASKAENAANETAQTNEVALATIARLEELEESLVGQYKMIPTAMTLTYPKVITLRNPSALRIAYELFPTNTGRNVMFLSDDNAISVLPNGGIVVRGPGISKVHAIPTENTEIYQTVEIKVVEPYMRKTAPSAIRLTGSGNIRLT
ncbi:hypothetical protein [Alistipes timonensis]|uniref:hypothetical protein n=1 Tax=Alistipes timonensis TaxID=1465754 RepID=UPI0026707DCA|nr:hypothetical protein [Alistipes timonensis]